MVVLDYLCIPTKVGRPQYGRFVLYLLLGNHLKFSIVYSMLGETWISALEVYYSILLLYCVRRLPVSLKTIG